MHLQCRATRVAERTEVSVGGGGQESEHHLLDVRLEPVAGDGWTGGPAGTISLTFDDSSQFAFWHEGRTYVITLVGE
jgi:hypothetical protein